MAVDRHARVAAQAAGRWGLKWLTGTLILGTTLVITGCAAALIGKASSSGAYENRPQGTASGSNRTSAQAAEDRRITAAVRSKLLADPVAKALVVGIDTQQGVVTLRGDALKAEQISAAERVARSVAGVRNVRNEMRVR